jgi:hypothetical protein
MGIHLIITADANVNSPNIHQRNVPSNHAVTRASLAIPDAGKQ